MANGMNLSGRNKNVRKPRVQTPIENRQNQLLQYGIGQETDYSNPYGMFSKPPQTKLGDITRGILGGIETGGDFLEYLTSPRDGLPKDVSDFIVNYLGGPSEYVKDQEKAQQEAINQNILEADSAMGGPFSPVELNKKIRDLTPSGPKLDRIAMDKEAQIAASSEAAGESALAQEVGADIEKKGGVDAFGKLFQESMDEFNQNVRGTSQKSQSKTIDDYKKEFADATGIDISGKVDKSAALMSLGLALMQNRAGKGFNVGRILSSVGEAGEKAMPALLAARKEAKAAQLAAGKYALEQVAAEKSAAAAFAKERRAANDAFRLKLMELSQKAMKDKAAGKELKNVGPNEIIQGVKINYGTSAGNTVLAKPSADAALVSNAWNKYTTGQNNINKLLTIAEELAETPAPAFETFGNRVKRQLGNLGLRDPEIDFGPDGATPEDRFNAMRLSVINEMKRLIIQESQVSDYDRKMLDASFGEINLTTTPQQTVFALNEMLNYFNGKKQNLVLPLEHMYDPDFYTSDEEYNRTIKYLQNSLDVPYVPQRARNEGGTTTTKPVANVDLTKAN